MGAVQGDLVAGVLVERGEGEGAGTLGVPEGLGQGWTLLGFCVRCQLSNFWVLHDVLERILIECFSSASTSSAHLLPPTIAKISSSALSKSSFSPWRIMVSFLSSTLKKSITAYAHRLARRLTGRSSCAAGRRSGDMGVGRLQLRVWSWSWMIFRLWRGWNFGGKEMTVREGGRRGMKCGSC